MKRLISSLCLAVVCSAACLVPALAIPQQEDPATSTVLLPVRLTGLGLGMAVGIPAASIRQVSQRIPENTRSIAQTFGGEDDPVSLAFAIVPGTTAGILQGVAEGCYKGTKNAMDNCMDRPFSTAAFSLQSESD